MQIGIAEWLEKVSKLKKDSDKVEAFKMNDSFALRVIMRAMYDPTVEWDMPEGEPPYTPNKIPDQQGILLSDIRYIFYFLKGDEYHPNLSKAKKEKMFIEFLERLDPADARMLVLAKDKKSFKGITVDHVKEGLPGLIPNEQKANEEV